MTIKVTRPQIDLREEVNKALTAQTLENQDATVKSLVSKGGLSAGGTATADQYLLDAIEQMKAESAFDVLVYDTRKDSDGGAWRKRTQHTSWYNETLNTETRGSRREFPSVAVITLHTSAITIYDGDDPNMPMWMKFTQSSGQSFTNGGQASYVVGGCGFATAFGLSMLNGTLVIPHHGGCSAGDTREGILILNFLSEKGEWVTDTDAANLIFAGPISNRNSNMSLSLNTPRTRIIVDSEVNDTDIIVLPNAPIDSTTRLPIPTIAVAGQMGASIIKDDGYVLDELATTGSGGLTVDRVKFVKDQNNDDILLVAYGDNTATPVYAYSLPILLGQTTWSISGSENIAQFGHDGTRDAYLVNIESNTIPTELSRYSKNKAAIGSTEGLSIVNINNDGPQVNKGNDASVNITSSYNTGWMVGDVRLASLSSTDESDAASTNLVLNGTFDSNTDNWAGDSGAVVTWNSGVATVAREAGGDYTYAIGQNFNTSVLAAGDEVYVSFRVYPTQTQRMRVRLGGGGEEWFSTSLTANAWQTIEFIATMAGSRIEIASSGGGNMEYFELDDVVITKTEPDRSSSQFGTGLQIAGTVTKTPVAPGAELMGYSDFTASDGLVQLYTSDLEPSTGDYSVALWFKTSATNNEQTLLRRFGNPTVTGGFLLRMVSSSSGIQWYTRDTSSNVGQITTTNALDDNVWHQIVGTRKGATMSLYIDGELYDTEATSADSHDAGTTAKLHVGVENTANIGVFANPASVSTLALARYSLTAPTPQQIKKMYDDEKMLFRENAKASLHGTSNSVTALSYDASTELLHVGTSAGRSEFQGVNRIDNTINAITSAISASNGLVAEE